MPNDAAGAWVPALLFFRSRVTLTSCACSSEGGCGTATASRSQTAVGRPGPLRGRLVLDATRSSAAALRATGRPSRGTADQPVRCPSVPPYARSAAGRTALLGVGVTDRADLLWSARAARDRSSRVRFVGGSGRSRAGSAPVGADPRPAFWHVERVLCRPRGCGRAEGRMGGRYGVPPRARGFGALGR